ncbi:MAG TPA: hypothetical protein IGR64_01565 [Leptolyngbyaceae cyanobacterium M65_K2018_010]|nr:hypothetical protein [Leptolyngbyaceae cyanobacterium M65_K2018_010]
MITPPRSSLQAIVDQIFAERRITRQVQHDLMQVLLSEAQLSSQDQALAERVFEAIKQGKLRVVE